MVGHGYCLMVDSEGVAGLSEGAALPDLFDLVADMPDQSDSEYCTHSD